jgi:AcrR family transcriptional regulator
MIGLKKKKENATTKDTAKERIIEATIQLLCEGKKPNEITVAEITQLAGVGNGMINYHFQSKDNLMRTSVKRVMVCAKKELSEEFKAYDTCTVQEKMAFILKETLNTMSVNPEICKIAILDNLENEEETLHLLSDVKEFNQCLEEMYKGDSRKIWITNGLIAGFMNFIFLKASAMKKEVQFDFSNKEQRDGAIDYLLKKLVDQAEED